MDVPRCMIYSPRFPLKSLDKRKAFLVLTRPCTRQAPQYLQVYTATSSKKKSLAFPAVRISNMTQQNWIFPFFIVEGLQSSLKFQSENQRPQIRPAHQLARGQQFARYAVLCSPWRHLSYPFKDKNITSLIHLVKIVLQIATPSLGCELHFYNNFYQYDYIFIEMIYRRIRR